MQSVVINRLKACLVVGVFALLITGSMRADDLPSPAPHLFDYEEMPVGDLQLFSWRDISAYGDGPQPNTGFFFSWDFMHMSVNEPDRSPIGVVRDPFSPRLIDTGVWNNQWNQGNRFEGGWMKENNRGMLFSGFAIHALNDELFYSDAAVIIFDNAELEPFFPPIFGFQPFASNPVFDTLEAKLSTHVWGGEAMRLWRFDRLNVPFFPVVEFMLGARYMDIRDRFDVTGRFGLLTDDDQARWHTRARNRMVGPQMGLRMYREHGPWGLNLEGRFFAAFNYQKVSTESEFKQLLYNVTLDDLFLFGVPFLPTASNDSDHEVEWAPTMEMRIEWDYLLTKAITLRVGANGTYVAEGIVRAPNKVDYSNLAPIGLSTSRLKPGNNDMNLLAWGIYMGVEVNR